MRFVLLIENPTVRLGAVLRKKAEILPFGSVRLADIVNPTVWLGAVMHPTVRLGAVRCSFQKQKNLRCGSVRCLKSKMLRSGSVRFSEIRNITVRFGAVFRHIVNPTTVRFDAVMHPTMRFGAVPR